jgi:hypothetical protein
VLQVLRTVKAGAGCTRPLRSASQRTGRVELEAALLAAVGRGSRAPQDDHMIPTEASVSLYLFASASLAVLDCLQGQGCDPPSESFDENSSRLVGLEIVSNHTSSRIMKS